MRARRFAWLPLVSVVSCTVAFDLSPLDEGCDRELFHAQPACARDANLEPTCGIQRCASWFADCDGVAGNGCEVDLATSANCGACGTSCPGGQACIDHVCSP